MPPLILIMLGIVGGAALAKFAAKESRRINRELDEARQHNQQDGGSVSLRRDPETGAYRPHS